MIWTVMGAYLVIGLMMIWKPIQRQMMEWTADGYGKWTVIAMTAFGGAQGVLLWGPVVVLATIDAYKEYRNDR